MVENRKNSFEFLGYDFMIDEDLKVWLIEINSSPSMDLSTVIYFINNLIACYRKVSIACLKRFTKGNS